MKIKYLFLPILSIIISSCSKDNIESPIHEKKLKTVKFSVASFEQSHKTMSSLHSDNKTKLGAIVKENSKIKQLLFVVCNENHFPLSYSRKDPTVGAVDFKLNNGKYIVKVFATTFGQNESELKNENNNAVALYLPTSTFINEKGQRAASYNSGEVFIGHRTIEVNKDSTYAALQLNRFNSVIELNIKDLAPSDLGYIEIKTGIGHVLTGGIGSSPFEGTRYSGNTITPDNRVDHSMVIDAQTAANKRDFTLNYELVTKSQTFLSLSEKQVYVTIRAYDTLNKVIATKNISNVKLMPNTITKLSGSLFEDFNRQKEGTFQITYETDFSSTSFTHNF